MNDKQFFTSTLKRALSEQSNELRDEMNRRFDEADKKYMMMFNEILNAIGHRSNEYETIMTQQSAIISNHEYRILLLETN